MRDLGRALERRLTRRARRHPPTTLAAADRARGCASLWGARHSANAVAELVLPSASQLTQMQSDVCRSRQFSADGYCLLLKDAVRLLRLGAQFEDAIEVNKLLLAVYETQEAYQELSETHGAIADLVRRARLWGRDVQRLVAVRLRCRRGD